MTVVAVTRDPAALTLTLTARFDAPVERVWQVWADPRQLERWWGPPGFPAAVGGHDLVPGGRVAYAMTGPDGEEYHGWWRVLAVSAPHALEFEDGFADDDGAPKDGMPVTTTRVTLSEADGGTAMRLESRFASAADMEQLVAMQVEEGMTQAMRQIDGVLGTAG